MSCKCDISHTTFRDLRGGGKWRGAHCFFTSCSFCTWSHGSVYIAEVLETVSVSIWMSQRRQKNCWFVSCIRNPLFAEIGNIRKLIWSGLLLGSSWFQSLLVLCFGAENQVFHCQWLIWKISLSPTHANSAGANQAQVTSSRNLRQTATSCPKCHMLWNFSSFKSHTNSNR